VRCPEFELEAFPHKLAAYRITGGIGTSHHFPGKEAFTVGSFRANTNVIHHILFSKCDTQTIFI
jgi:hypothetical protein